MKKSLIIAALFAAALAVSCENKEVAPEAVPQEKEMVTFTLQLPSSDSKVAVDINGNVGKVRWEAGDKIHIHTGHIKDGEATTVELTADDISADGSSAKITFPALTPYNYAGWGGNGADYSTYYAAYPAEATNNPGSCYQRQYFGDSNNILMAASDKDGVFHFHNLCGLITFTVSGDYDSYAFCGNNDEVVGYESYVAVVNAGVDEYEYLREETTGALTVITGTLSSGVNYIGLPNGTDFSGGFAIRFKKNGVFVKEAKTTSAVNVERNKILPLGDITSKLTDYTAPAHHSSITNAVDLGATETANCYVITAPGSYKIPVVKGNSNESAGTRASVRLLWETCNSAEGSVEKNSVIAAVDYDEDDNYVYFQTPNPLLPGNALIAAVDSEGEILWSWHIWIPATAITDLADASFYNKKIMDRNLGALSAVTDAATLPTYGLYYQWGRKDPMFTSNWKRNASLDLAYSGNSSAGDCVTTDESIKNPTTFYYMKTSEGAYNWNKEEITTLWDDSTSKTIYDPCPAGYRVPKYNSELAMWHHGVADGWSQDANNGFYKYGDIVFPYAGYASGSSIDYAGVRAVVWSATYSDKERGKGAVMRSTTDPIYHYNSYYKPYLCSVRCCLIEGEVLPDVTPEPQASITIDGDMTDWKDVVGGTSGTHTFKIAADENNLYFYHKRDKKDALWANSDGPEETRTYGGYLYVGFDLDGNAENGEILNTNGPFDYIFFVTPYTGTAEAPAIAEDFTTLGYGAACKPDTATMEHVVGKGVITSDAVEVEYSIPRADMPEIPTTAIKIDAWGNKSLSHVILNKIL